VWNRRIYIQRKFTIYSLLPSIVRILKLSYSGIDVQINSENKKCISNFGKASSGKVKIWKAEIEA
jgi:hypothetical protein